MKGVPAVLYVTVFVGALAVATLVLIEFARKWPRRGDVESRGAWIAGLSLLAVGAVFFIVAAIDLPGFDLGEDLEFGDTVDSLGGGFVATGYAIAAMLLTFLLLGVADSARSGGLLTRVGVAAVPFMAALTVLTALFDRDEWRDSNIGPLVGAIAFFTLPALLAGWLLARSGTPPGRPAGRPRLSARPVGSQSATPASRASAAARCSAAVACRANRCE